MRASTGSKRRKSVMPIDIESFTTEVTLVDGNSSTNAAQFEQLVQEVMRRIERKQRDDQKSRENSSFDALNRGRRS